ncbi:MAG: hypothetical protein AB7I50_14520 [Vicinamibacterales bacterium]
MTARTMPLAVGQPRAWVCGLVIAGLLSAAIGLQVWRERAFPRDVAEETVLYLASGPALQRIALSFDALLADVYWIRAIQHYGGTRRSDDPQKRYHLLYPLLSLAASLDPLFTVVYRFGAIFLAEPWPGGPGQPDQAVALLQRGLEARPAYWRYMQDIGFVYYWSNHDYRKAAEWFQRGADVPGAPIWMRSLTATTLAQGGDRSTSRLLWRSLAEGDADWLKRESVRRLQQLDALDALDQLQPLVRQAVAQGLPKPYSWEALVRARLLRAVPLDPTGHPYELGPWSGDVSLAYESPLNPLPTEPLRKAAP